MKKTVIALLIFLVVVAGYFLVKNDVIENEKGDVLKQENQKKLVGSLIKKRINKALKKADRNKRGEEETTNEVAFIQKTELEPLSREEVLSLKGEDLRKRIQELDVKLDHAIQKHPDLPPPPEWYKDELEYLGNKFYATIGKSRRKTELSKEEKEKQSRYLEYLANLEQKGIKFNNEEIAEQKRKIYGE